MKKIETDFEFDIDTKGVRILFSHLEEGLEYVRKQKTKNICIWQGDDNSRYTVNFDFLRGLEFIETFYWLVSLTKKSDIQGIYFLPNLKEFSWAVDNDINIDFSKLTTIEIMNIPYHKGLMNLEKLTNLKELYIQSVKTENLNFLSELDNLEHLRIINGKFTSLEGLEHCRNLKELEIARCFNLIYADATLRKLSKLESVILKSCKKNDVDVESLQSQVAHVWIR